MKTMTVRPAHSPTYVYRLRERGPLHIVRRPAEGFTDHEWTDHLCGTRSKVFIWAGGHAPAYENVTVHGKQVHVPGTHTSRHAEIATILSRLVGGCKPGHEPYIVDNPRY